MTLTQNKEHEKYVACDDPTCGQKYYTQFRSDSPALRTELRHARWVTGNDGDVHFCPVHRPKTQLEHNLASQLNEDVPEIKAALDSAFKTIAASENRDMVNHPAHYNAGKFEVIDVIDDWKLGFALGNAVKYIARAAHKGSELQDLQKAKWYLEHRIKQLEALNGGPLSLSGGPPSPSQKLTGGGYMCPFCKSSVFKARANREEVFCVCGATVKWECEECKAEREGKDRT